MNENENEKKTKGVEGNKKKIIALAVALVLLIGGTYAWLSITLNGTKTTRIEAGTLSLILSKESNAISMENALPMSNAEGTATTPYTFTLENNGTVDSEYTIFLDKQAISETESFDMPQNRISYKLTKTIKQKSDDSIVSKSTDKTGLLSDIASEDTTYAILDSSESSSPLNPNQYIEYELRLWIHESAENSDMQKEIPVADGSDEKKTIYAEYSGKLRIKASQTGIEKDDAYDETEITP